VINEEDYVSKTPEKCMHRNDWPKWKDALKAELDSLEKRNIFRPVILTPKNVNPVGYKWVFAIKRNEKNEIVRYKQGWWHKVLHKYHELIMKKRIHL
jgi:hypothetical protein